MSNATTSRKLVSIAIQTKLYHLLRNKDYYSLNLSYVSSILNMPVNSIKLLVDTFEERFGDELNIFMFNNVEYIGLQSRKIDYDRDTLNGTNWVEKAIKDGHYD